MNLLNFSSIGNLSLPILLMLLLVAVNSKAQDVTPPVLHSISIVTDTVYDQDTVFAIINVTDDISGFRLNTQMGLHFRDANFNMTGNQVTINNWQHLQGNEYIGYAIPMFAYTGTYRAVVTHVFVYDNAGNSSSNYNNGNYCTDTLVAIGTAVDTIGPELISLWFDTTHYSALDTVTVQMIVRDTSSGILNFSIDMKNSIGQIKVLTDVQSTISNDTVTFKRTFPVWGIDGDWSVYRVVLRDNVGNTQEYFDTTDYSGSFNVTGLVLDTTPPAILSFSITPLNAHRGDSMTMVIEVVDSVAGIGDLAYVPGWGNIAVSYVNPAGQQSVYLNRFVRIAGTNFFTMKFKLNELAANGPWHTNFIGVSDRILNSIVYSPYNGLYHAGIQDTFYVTPDSSRTVQGVVLTSTGDPLENSRVYMVKVVPIDSTLISFRTAYTDVDGQYAFISEVRDSLIYIKAVPNDTIYTSELPTYLDTASLFQNATLVHVNTALTIIDTFQTNAGNNPGGHGFLQGHIYSGAGKQSSDPVIAQTLILMNAGIPTAFATTDSLGEFRFENLPDGTYQLFADWPGIDNATAPTVVISPSEFSLTGYDYQVVGNSLQRIVVGIEELAKNHGITVFPNPVQGVFKVTVKAKEANTLSFELLDINGKRIQNLVTKELSNNSWEVEAGTLPTGQYFLSISDGKEGWNLPVLVAK